ncbi:MAG: hypothetical protein AMXMBFR64_02450 [Myxococcales bacterium]
MKWSLLGTIRRILDPPPREETDAPPLSDREHATLYALLEVAAGASDLPRERLRDHLARQVAATPALLAEYRSAARLLDRVARRGHGERPFAALDLRARDSVLRELLRTYPHEEREPAWRRLTRLTGDNLDLVIAPRDARRLRNHVLRDLLRLYYSSTAGWAVVSYDRRPGRAKRQGELR